MIEGGKKALDTHGAGLSSVRFICGTQVGAMVLFSRAIVVPFTHSILDLKWKTDFTKIR